MTTAVFALYYAREKLSSKVLAWLQRSEYSHCERVMLIDSNGVGYCGSSSFLDGGVRTKWIDLDPAKWELYEIEINPTRDRHVNWFLEHAGERYDVLGLLGFVWRRIKGWAKAWWCSEACLASVGWEDPWRYDVALLASLLKSAGRRVSVADISGDPA